MRKLEDGFNIFIIKAVSGMNFESQPMSYNRGPFEAIKFDSFPCPSRVRIGTCVKLNGLGPYFFRRMHLMNFRIDEKTHPDSGIAQSADGGPQARATPQKIETSFGGQLLSLLRNECRLIRSDADRDSNNSPIGRHLQVERRLQDLLQIPEVLFLNVPAILTEMADDPVATGLLGDHRRPHGTWNLAAAGLPKGGDMIDVDP